MNSVTHIMFGKAVAKQTSKDEFDTFSLEKNVSRFGPRKFGFG